MKLGRPQVPLFERLDKNIQKDDCWIWLGYKDKDGYGRIKSTPDSEGKKIVLGVHRVMYERYKEPIPAGMFILHSCDNPSCCNPDHLSVGTAQDNSNDMKRRGRTKLPSTAFKRGHGACESNIKSKLTKEDVEFIRAYPKYYGSQMELVLRFGVSREAIRDIQIYKTWK